MGDVRTLAPRPDAPAARPLSTAVDWEVVRASLRAVQGTAAEALALVESRAPVAEILAAVGRLTGRAQALRGTR